MSLTSLRSSPTLTNAALAGTLAAALAWLGPPGTDFPAHVFQLHQYIQHGFAFWTNYWYAGRYTFVGYSILYYPLAALFGIRLLAVISVAASAAAFTLVIRQTWGDSTVWATRFFAVVAAASVVSAAFPYGLGLALALTAVVAIARRRLVLFSILAALTLAASPLAFLFLLLVLGAAAVSHSWREIEVPAAIAITICFAGPRRLAPLPRPRRVPVRHQRTDRGARLLHDRSRTLLASRARPDPAHALPRLRRGLPPGLPDPVDARRERRAPAVRRDSAGRTHTLPAAVATASDRDHRHGARARLEPLAARSGASRAARTTPPPARPTGRP